jgi:hypothetical protein
MDKRHNDVSCGSAKAYSTLWWPPLVKGYTQPLSSDPEIKLECHFILPYIPTHLWGISTRWSLSRLTQDNHNQNQNQSKGGRRSHTQKHNTTTHARKPKKQAQELYVTRTTRNKRSDLPTITELRGCDESECWCALGILGYCSMAHRGPFYSPNGPRSRWSSIRKFHTFLVCVCTRQHLV